MHLLLVRPFILTSDLSYLDVLYQEREMVQITNDDFRMFWEKVIEWSNKEHMHIYKAFVRVSLKIFNCKEGCDVNITDEKGNTPLIIYSLLNESSVIKCLLDNGSNVNHVGHKGWNALHALFSSLGTIILFQILMVVKMHYCLQILFCFDIVALLFDLQIIVLKSLLLLILSMYMCVWISWWQPICYRC